MKALITNSPTTTVQRSRHGLPVLMALIMVVALSLGLAAMLYLRVPAQVIAPTSNVNTYAPLDQHERHPASLVINSAAHEISWPRRREVWEITRDVDNYAPLDQHERHPATAPRRSAFDPAAIGTGSVYDGGHYSISTTPRRPAFDPAAIGTGSVYTGQ